MRQGWNFSECAMRIITRKQAPCLRRQFRSMMGSNACQVSQFLKYAISNSTVPQIAQGGGVRRRGGRLAACSSLADACHREDTDGPRFRPVENLYGDGVSPPAAAGRAKAAAIPRRRLRSICVSWPSIGRLWPFRICLNRGG